MNNLTYLQYHAKHGRHNPHHYAPKLGICLVGRQGGSEKSFSNKNLFASLYPSTRNTPRVSLTARSAERNVFYKHSVYFEGRLEATPYVIVMIEIVTGYALLGTCIVEKPWPRFLNGCF